MSKKNKSKKKNVQTEGVATAPHKGTGEKSAGMAAKLAEKRAHKLVQNTLASLGLRIDSPTSIY